MNKKFDYPTFVKKWGDRPKDILFQVASSEAFVAGQKQAALDIFKELDTATLGMTTGNYIYAGENSSYQKLKSKYLGCKVQFRQ